MSAADVRAEYVKRVTAELARMGYVVLKEKSYRAAQERQRIAEALRRSADEDKASQRAWLERDVFPWERHLVHRVDHLAGLARSLGATSEQFLGGQPCTCGRGACAASQTDRRPHAPSMASSAQSTATDAGRAADAAGPSCPPAFPSDGA